MVLTLSSLLEAARKAELDKIKVERVNSHEGVFHIHHYELYHPNLPRILKVYVTINEKNKNYGNVDIVGDHADYNKVGPSEIRALARQLKNELGITHIGGIRTGGSRGSLKDPLKSSTIIKISEEYLFENGGFWSNNGTLLYSGKAKLFKTGMNQYDDGVEHLYDLKHSEVNRGHPIFIKASVYKNSPHIAYLDITGSPNDYNKVGTVELRNVGRKIKEDIGVTHFASEGPRIGNNKRPVPPQIIRENFFINEEEHEELDELLIRNSSDDIFQTKDLNKLSAHLSQKHGAHVELYPHHQGSIYLSTLIVPKHLRGKGVASNALKDVIHYAKIHKVKVVLNAEPLDDETKEKRLIDFYKSHGFVENKGRNRDLTVGGSQQKNTMYTRTEI